jgi:protein TonB
MEAKKTKKADLQSWRVLFFETGLILALVVVVGVFAWGRSDREVENFITPEVVVPAEVMVNTTQNDPAPKVKLRPIQALSDYIEVVRGDITIEVPPWVFDPDIVWTPAPLTAEALEDDIPHFNAEEMPTFQGGTINDFRSWVQSRLQYPRMAIENSIQGTVTLKFVIERDGSLSNIEEIATPDRSLTEEAIRVLKMSPKWSPGKQRNKPVRVFYILPVQFQLQS